MDLVCHAWHEITDKAIKHAWDPLLPHFKLQQEHSQTHESLLKATTEAVHQVPGMSNVEVESVQDMVLSLPEEKSLKEMMEADEVEEETPKEKDSELTTTKLSCLLGGM